VKRALSFDVFFRLGVEMSVYNKTWTMESGLGKNLV
jgi:hypothetical protein